MKKLLRLLTCVFTLSLLLAIPVSANGNIGIGESGETTEGSANLSGQDGFSGAKTGYIVYTSDASGNPTSDVVAFTWDGSTPYSTSGCPVMTALETRFGSAVTLEAWGTRSPWGFPPFSGTSGTGGAVKAWLLAPQGNYACGADYVMMEILKFSEAQVMDWYADINNRLNIEPLMYGGWYIGQTHTGRVLVGSTNTWAKFTQPDNWGGRYTHGNLCNSMYHDEQVYAQLPVPPSVSGKHDSGTILSHAYGIVTVKPVKGVQVVKIYKTSGVVDNTSYGFGEPPINVKDEGSYKVTKWSTSKQKTKATSNKADWGEVVAGCELVQSGSGVAVVDMPPAEKAIFILLEREKEVAPVVLNQESIRAHELNLIFRYSDGLRDEFNGKNGRFEGSNFRFNDVKHLYEKIPSDTIQNYEMDKDYEVVEEVSGGTAESGRPTHYYKSDDLQVYKAWDEVKDPFALDEIVNPHYSINVSRVFWEDNLHTVEYRDSGYNGYVEEVLGITPSLIGEETSANPGSNVENTLPEVQTNTYKYTAKLQHRWQERDAWEETANDGSTHTAYGSWRDMEKWIEHHIVTYTVNTYCDKFKVMVTPQASIESAGTILEESRGNTILGHDAIAKQIVATQLGGTLTFYPEVPMTTWYTSDLVNYAEPENKLVYILGEYPRKCTAPCIHGYTTRVQGGKLTGTTTLPAASTGRVAEDTYSYYADKGTFINGVTAMGTTFETATLNRYEMTIGSVIFDCTDNYGVESAWNNEWVDPKGSHDAYESQLVSRLDMQMILQFFKGGSTKHGEPYTMTADVSDMSITREEKTVELIWKEGDLVNKGDVIAGISWALNADGASLYAKWGLDEMLDTMYISCVGDAEQNASGNDLSGESAIARANP